MNTKNNTTLELLKLIASYMVVFIHVLFYGKMGVIFDTLARFAVPFFFLISGFFSYQISASKIKKRTSHIFSLLIFSTLCYTLFNVASLLLSGTTDQLILYFSKYADVTTLVKLFVFNVSVSATHLWYLFAMLYVYVIFYFVTLCRANEKVIFIVSFSLLFLHIVLGECLSALGIAVPVPIVRNFVLTGIPFFGLGLFIKKHETKLHGIPNYILVISFIIGMAESLFSRYCFGKNEVYIGSLLILFAIVCTFIKYSNVQYPSFVKALTGCSTYVYIFHIIISAVIAKTYSVLGIDINSSVILQNMHPILVCLASTAFAYIIIQISKRLTKKKTETV